MIKQDQCERCAALERENEALKKRNGELEGILQDRGFDALRTIASNTDAAISVALQSKSGDSHKLLEAYMSANDRHFSQRQALAELPLKIEQTKAKTDNITTRTALAEADIRLKEEKIKGLQADRSLKEQQARLLEAATRVLERYANTGNMVDADFEVIDQLKEIGLKIPAKVSAKKLKQTNGVR